MTRFKTTIELIEIAGGLANNGATNGEVADELNVSRATASWLVRKSDAGVAPFRPDKPARSPQSPEYRPQDIHVDWSTIGRNSSRLVSLGQAMADLLSEEHREADLTVGIEKAGAPLATVISQELETALGTYAPAKHQWNAGDIEEFDGSFSRNFARISDCDCYIVDDTITSGTTMRETVNAVRAQGGNPVACVVLADKQGVTEAKGVPVSSLINVVRVDSE